MSNTLIAFLIAVSATTWIYTKVSNKTGGGNPRDSVIVAGVCGVVIFAFAYFLLGMILK